MITLPDVFAEGKRLAEMECALAGAAIHCVPSTERARRELGLACEVPLADAIRRTHAWYQARGAYAASR